MVVHQMLVEGYLAVVMWVGPGEECGTRRSTYRLGTIGTREHRATVGKGVQSGHADVVVPIRGEGAALLLIRNHEQQVRGSLRGRHGSLRSRPLERMSRRPSFPAAGVTSSASP